MSVDQNRKGNFALVTAAVGAGFAGGAQAAIVSTAPSGYSATISTTASNSVTFDLNGDGVTDFTLSGGTNFIDVFSPSPSNTTASTATSPKFALPFPSLSRENLNGTNPGVVSSVVKLTATGFDTLFTPGTSASLALSFDAGGQQDYGYITGTLTETVPDVGPNSASFTVTDFGYDTTPLPEASSLALLASGVAGVLAFRRRRAALPA